MALAALLPETSLSACNFEFSVFAPAEVELLRELNAVGQRCLTEFSKAALCALRNLGPEDADVSNEDEQGDILPPVAAPQIHILNETGKEVSGKEVEASAEQRRIKRMFDHFDTNKTGLLTEAQFRDVLKTVGLSETFSENELDSLVEVVDKNGDKFIDLHEFAEWVCSSNGEQPQRDDSNEQNGIGDGEGRSRQDVESNLREQLREARAQLQTAESELKQARNENSKALKSVEEELEAETEESQQFWRALASSSATPRLCDTLDLDSATLLGNGKYGFVLKSKQTSDGREVVVKLLSLRWSRVAAKEWAQAQNIGEHPHIITYEDALLHADNDKRIATILSAAQDEGRIQTRTKRESFPDRFLCLTQEFMNKGTVQDWMDRDALLPGGMLVVLRCVADALAHMHRNGITHNDVKPENVMLRQDEGDSSSGIVVKLGDLGLAAKSTDRSKDSSLYGLTLHSMSTKKKFGSCKFQPEVIDRFVAEVAKSAAMQEDFLDKLGCDERTKSNLLATIAQLPGLLRKIWRNQVSMDDIKDWPTLKGWSFFDGAGPASS
jgi:tRNA A-37 threonylcarbamoyl transferase component Bud32